MGRKRQKRSADYFESVETKKQKSGVANVESPFRHGFFIAPRKVDPFVGHLPNIFTLDN